MIRARSRLRRLPCCLLAAAASDVPEQFRLSYTGNTFWAPETGTITFQTSGRMLETKEGFFWEVPPEVKTVMIQRNTTVNGGFRVRYSALILLQMEAWRWTQGHP
jgi:hypothetical protein